MSWEHIKGHDALIAGFRLAWFNDDGLPMPISLLVLKV
jgi:hypothetical protein